MHFLREILVLFTTKVNGAILICKSTINLHLENHQW